MENENKREEINLTADNSDKDSGDNKEANAPAPAVKQKEEKKNTDAVKTNTQEEKTNPDAVRQKTEDENTGKEKTVSDADNLALEIDKIIQDVRKKVESEETRKSPAIKTEDKQDDGFVDISSGVAAAQATPRTDTKRTVSAENTNTVKMTGNKNAGKEKKSGGLGKYAVIGLVGAVALLGISFFAVMQLNPAVIPVNATIEIPDGTVPPVSEEPVFLKGIQVAGVDIGGKTLEEAQALLSLKGADLISDITIKVTDGDESYSYSKDDFEYTYDIPGTLQKAYDFNSKVLEKGSADASGNAEASDTVFVDPKAGTVNFKLDCKVTEASVQKVVKRIAKEIDIPCVEPHVSKFDTQKVKFEFKEGQNGSVIDQDKLRADILEVFESGNKEADLTVTKTESKPTLSMNDVKGATVLLAKFSTVSSNGANANHNMATALEAINGTILEPGETFSFNDTTGDSNQYSNGYLDAGVISDGEMTTGVGGGICQAATTIYNAAIRANMEIVERQPHRWCSFYVYGGLDATIDWGWIDLKLKNTTKYQMFFKTYMEGVTLYCEIYGWQSPDFDEVRTESECTWSDSKNYGYAAQRVFYLKGKEVKREDLPDSYYYLDNGAGIRPGDPGDVSTKIER